MISKDQINTGSTTSLSVGYFFDWENAFEEVDENNFDPSAVLMHLGHQKEDLALKSPVITQKYGLCLFMSLKKFLKNRQK